jgi:hypothetical protein
MEGKAREKGARQRLMESIMEAGNRAFNPDASESSRAQGMREFDDLMQRQAQPANLSLLHAVSGQEV